MSLNEQTAKNISNRVLEIWINSEIAEKMKVNQSTISRDLQYLQQEAKKSIWKYLNEDILFEYLRYIIGNNEISKKLWEIVQDENASEKDKTNALSFVESAPYEKIRNIDE